MPRPMSLRVTSRVRILTMARIVMTHDSAALVRGNASTKEETL